MSTDALHPTLSRRELLRGTPGSTVTLTIIRGNAAEPVEIELERGGGRSANVTSRLVAPGVGYLRIAEFDDTTTDAIEAAIGTLDRQGAERLLIDLRVTATGPFESGIDAARLFTSADTLVIRESSTEQEPVNGAGEPAVAWPVVILTDPGTAGAAPFQTIRWTGRSWRLQNIHPARDATPGVPRSTAPRLAAHLGRYRYPYSQMRAITRPPASRHGIAACGGPVRP